MIRPIPPPKRGAFRDRHERWKRDAMDASHHQTNDAERGRRSRVVLAPRRWREVGDDAFASGQRRRQEPDRRRELGISRKTIAQGMFWPKKSLNINVVRVLCRRLC